MNIHQLQSKDDQGAGNATSRSVQDTSLAHFQSRNPPNAATSFTDAQLAAIKQIVDQQGGGNHKINVRVFIPPLFRRYYFAIFSGTEKHSRARRRSEARLHPIFRAANKVFLSLLLVFAVFSVIGFLFALDIAWEQPSRHGSSLEIPKPPLHH